MPERLTPRQFQESDGVEDWRDVGMGAGAVFRTGSFNKGIALVDEIGRLADAMNHHPDVDLQYGTVTVRLFTHDIMGLSDLDAKLAAQISAAARTLGAESDPSNVQSVQLTLDALVTENVRPFWCAVLGYKAVGDEDAIDPRGRGPSIWFQQMNPARTERNRFHIDVFVGNDEAEARVAAALAAGGRLLDDAHAPDHWLLADAEGNEVDVATTFHRD
ncbi:MAG: 4a-hydroxytetrahydrobiopterin dehydratase [Actinomycetota bacterium]|jgi:4a-hydroxytetrahydrobiopterin dehydratase